MVRWWAFFCLIPHEPQTAPRCDPEVQLWLMWYVLEAGREAKLVYGLKQNCTKAEMRRAIADGTVMKYLQKVPIHKDDLFFIGMEK